MTRTRSASVANFVCRFGDQHVLLDMADTVVIPAFVMGGHRMYAESRYIIQETTLENFGTENSPALVLVGRFINDTTMKRQQVLRAGKIVKSPATLESAPSAAFALVLDTHKLLYLPETPHAPAQAGVFCLWLVFSASNEYDSQRANCCRGNHSPRPRLPVKSCVDTTTNSRTTNS